MNPIGVKVCVDCGSLWRILVVTTELVTLVNSVDRVGSGRKSWSSIILLLLPALPPPAPTIVQSVITPHPVKFIVGMMYCLLRLKPSLLALFSGGKEGT